MPERDKDDEEHRSGAFVPLTGTAAPGAGSWGFGALLEAPRFAWLRVLAGAVAALNVAWFASPKLFPAMSARSGYTDVAWPTRAAQVNASDAERPAPGSLVRGAAGLWGAVTGSLDPDKALADAVKKTEPGPPGAEGSVKGGGKEGAGAGSGADKERKDGAGDGAAGAGEASVGGAGRSLGAGLLAGGAAPGGTGAPGTTAAALKAGAGGLPSQSGGNDAEAAKRDLRAARSLAGARGPQKGGASRALSQLRFADGRSRLGASAGAAGDSGYGAARSAFEGGPAGVAGSPIGGAGTAAGGAGMGAGSTPSGPLQRGGPGLTCPSGYQLSGSQCMPLPGSGENKTPYQGMADQAKTMLIIGAVLAAVGLMLLLAEVPWLQLLGGAMLGAALALIAVALAIGNQIDSRYGQGPQKRAIDDTAAAAAAGRAAGQPGR